MTRTTVNVRVTAHEVNGSAVVVQVVSEGAGRVGLGVHGRRVMAGAVAVAALAVSVVFPVGGVPRSVAATGVVAGVGFASIEDAVKGSGLDDGSWRYLSDYSTAEDLAFRDIVSGAFEYVEHQGSTWASVAPEDVPVADLTAPSSVLADAVGDGATAAEAAAAASGESAGLASSGLLELLGGAATGLPAAGAVIGGAALGFGIGRAVDTGACDAGVAAMCWPVQARGGFVGNVDTGASPQWPQGHATSGYYGPLLVGDDATAGAPDFATTGDHAFGASRHDVEGRHPYVFAAWQVFDGETNTRSCGGGGTLYTDAGLGYGCGLDAAGSAIPLMLFIGPGAASDSPEAVAPGDIAWVSPNWTGAVPPMLDPQRQWRVDDDCADGSVSEATSADFQESDATYPATPTPRGCMGSTLTRVVVNEDTIGGSSRVFAQWDVPAAAAAVEQSQTCASGGCVLLVEKSQGGSWANCDTLGAHGCAGWFTADPASYRCTYGPPGTEYVVTTAECNALAHRWDTTAVPVSDPRTGAPGNAPTPGPSPGGDPAPDPGPSTGPVTGPQITLSPAPRETANRTPQATGTPTAVVVPQPEPTQSEGAAPGSASADGSDPCFPHGWGVLNPVEWVERPSECALTWAFAPSPGLLDQEAADLADSLDNGPIGGTVAGLVGMVQPLETLGGSSGCAGPRFTFSLGGLVPSGGISPFAACDQPAATWAQLTRVALGCLLCFGAVTVAVRNILASLGLSVPIAAGEGEAE